MYETANSEPVVPAIGKPESGIDVVVDPIYNRQLIGLGEQEWRLQLAGYIECSDEASGHRQEEVEGGYADNAGRGNSPNVGSSEGPGQ